MTNQQTTGFQAFLGELKRRRVVRVALIYGAAAYAGLEGAELILSALRAPEWILSLLVMTVIVGFPITIVLSWVFDITPQGIKRTGSVASDSSVTWLSSGSLFVLSGIVLAVTVGWWLSATTGAVAPAVDGPEGIRSIAVLPFDNVGERSEDDYFADGFGDELRSILSRIGALDVAARTSSFRLREDADDASGIAERLGVRAVLRGTVLRDGERVHVTAELLSADGLQLWSAEYDRLVDDVFEMQSQVAHAILDALEMRLPSGEEMPMDSAVVTNAMAYDKYLWGLFNINRGTPAGVRDAVDNFGMSIGFDSTYAPAWTGLAEAYARQLERSGPSHPSEAISSGLAAAGRAVELDPGSVEARSALALFLRLPFDWAAAEKELQVALKEDPSSSVALTRYAEVLSATDRTEQAVAQIRAAVRVDELSPVVRRTAARILAISGRMDEAIVETQEALQLAPEDPVNWVDIGFMFLAAGRFEDSRNAFQGLAELESVDPEAIGSFVAAAERYLTTGSPGTVPRQLGALIEEPGTAALYHASVGDVRAAGEALALAVDRRAYDLPTLVRLPTLDPVRSGSAFENLLQTMGLHR